MMSLETISNIEWLYLGLGVYGIALGTYLLVREDTRIFGAFVYLLVLTEISLYFSLNIPFYILIVLSSFIGATGISYKILSPRVTEYKAQKYSILFGFGSANIAMGIIGLFTWVGLTSIAISLLAFELTMVGLEGDAL